MIHSLKSKPEYFNAVVEGRKTFEIRKNDRNFEQGDFLILQEWGMYQNNVWNPPFPSSSFQSTGYTGRIVIARVTYISAYEQQEGYVVLGLQVLDVQDLNAYQWVQPAIMKRPSMEPQL